MYFSPDLYDRYKVFPGYFTKENIMPVLKAYVDEDIFPLFTPADAFDADYNSSRAAIYGCDYDDIRKDLDGFRTFPASQYRFGWDTRYYRGSHFLRKGYNGETAQDYTTNHLYKQECYTMLMFKITYPEGSTNQHSLFEMVFGLCSIYMKHKEHALLGNVCELTEVDYTRFDRFAKDFALVVHITPRYEMKQQTYNYAKQAIKKALNKVCTKPIPSVSIPAEIDRVMQKAEENLKYAENKQTYKEVVHYVNVFIEEAEKFINEYISYFAASEVPVPKLRRFEHDKAKFFLATEVFDQLRQRNLDVELFKKDCNLSDDDELATISLEEVELTIDSLFPDFCFDVVERIGFPINRSFARAIFIPYARTKHCILMADALLEILRTWITVKGIFQKVHDWNTFYDAFFKELYALDPKFKEAKGSAPMFIDVDRVKEIKGIMNNKLTERFGDLLKDIKEMTPVGEENFKRDDLRRQIEALDLLKCFPNLVTLSEIFLPWFKKDRKLGTAEMYEIVEQCQLLAICQKLPDLYEWFKTQHYTDVYPFDCMSLETLLEREMANLKVHSAVDQRSKL